VFSGYGVSFGEDEKVEKDGGSDGCITVCVYLIPPSCTFKHGKFYFFVMYILP
jgi:hypothetical protein